MAEDSGVTEAGLKAKITDLLQATHVEIEDMSGIVAPLCPSIVLDFTELFTDHMHRWLWSSIFCHHSITTIREEDDPCKTPTGQYYIEKWSCCYSCLDPKMLYTWTVGEAKTRGKSGSSTRQRHNRRDCVRDQRLKDCQQDVMNILKNPSKDTGIRKCCQ